MYFHAAYHEIEECLILLVKIQDKRNQKNHNVQWIVVENKEEDGKNINIVIIVGAKIGEYVENKDQD